MNNYAFPLQLAKEAILLGRYTDALSLLKPLSKIKENTDARFLHAFLHFWDDELDQSTAIEFIIQAADRGHAEANYILAVCSDLTPGYIFSLPTAEPQQARLRLAAEHESQNALTDLAQCHLEGVGIEQDFKQARTLLQQVYDRTQSYRYLPKNCLLLAKMLLEGLGGKQDIEKAVRMLWRCNRSYGDPFADEAISLLIKIVEQGKYGPADWAGRELVSLRTDHEKIRAKHTTIWQRFLERYCLSTLRYDLRTASFDNFVGFIFEHFPVLPNERRVVYQWTHEADVIFDEQTLLQYYTQLFREPAFLLDRYRREEIERGLGQDGIRAFADWSVGCVMRSADATIEDIEDCIRATYDLFAKLFTQTWLEDVSYMWWDIGFGACGQGKLYKNERSESELQRIEQAIFETMKRILQIDSLTCQRAAIHGLNHWSHPDKEKVLLQFLEDNPDLPDYSRSFVMEAIRGRLL